MDDAQINHLKTEFDRRWEALEHRLFGNGQPGEIDKLKADVQALSEFRWKVVAWGTVIAAAIGFLTGDGIVSLRHILGR
jgi:hypothetical protein